MTVNASQTPTRLSARVAEEIRVLLTRRKMSGRELAARLNVSQSWMSTRLNGTTPIDVNDLQLIADELNVEVTDLFPRSSEGRLITTAFAPGDPPRETNERSVSLTGRPRPIGHPKRTVPDLATRRPARIRAALASA